MQEKYIKKFTKNEEKKWEREREKNNLLCVENEREKEREITFCVWKNYE